MATLYKMCSGRWISVERSQEWQGLGVAKEERVGKLVTQSQNGIQGKGTGTGDLQGCGLDE